MLICHYGSFFLNFKLNSNFKLPVRRGKQTEHRSGSFCEAATPTLASEYWKGKGKKQDENKYISKKKHSKFQGDMFLWYILSFLCMCD